MEQKLTNDNKPEFSLLNGSGKAGGPPSMTVLSILESKGRIAVTVGVDATNGQTFFLTPGRAKRLSLPLSEGMPVDEVLFCEIEQAAAVTSAVEQAAKILAGSDKSARALRQRLMEKGTPAEAAEAAVEFMIRKGYLDENRQAERLARAWLTGKLRGRRRIARDLYANGYGEEAIRHALSALTDEECSAAMKKYLDKAARSWYDEEEGMDEHTLRRMVASAERAGFSAREARRYLMARCSGQPTDE